MGACSSNLRDYPDNALYDAVYSHGLSKASSIIQRCDPNRLAQLINYRGKDGQTTLKRAFDTYDFDTLKNYFLSVPGVDPNIPDDKGKTLLHHACESRAKEVATFLAKHGQVDVNRQDKEGNAPLHIVAEKGFYSIMNALLSNEETDVNARNKEGRTALHLAVIHEFHDIVKALLTDMRIDPYVRDSYGRTPIFIAKFDHIRSLVSTLDCAPLSSKTPFPVPNVFIGARSKFEDGLVDLYFYDAEMLRSFAKRHKRGFKKIGHLNPYAIQYSFSGEWTVTSWSIEELIADDRRRSNNDIPNWIAIKGGPLPLKEIYETKFPPVPEEIGGFKTDGLRSLVFFEDDEDYPGDHKPVAEEKKQEKEEKKQEKEEKKQEKEEKKEEEKKATSPIIEEARRTVGSIPIY